MYKTKNLGLNITEMSKDKNEKFNFDVDLGDNFKAIDADVLTHRNISNCILEIPQRIKYTLENGTLTIKAGSVAIFPYGKNDLSEQFPIGASFINSWYKVIDAQYTNGNFYVWVEFQKDMTQDLKADVQSQIKIFTFSTDGYLKTNNFAESGSSIDLTEKTYTLHYNTDTNIIGNSFVDKVPDYSNPHSFPVMVGTASPVGISSVTQVFNGFGYIGSTIWADKGVKGLTPNGWNVDGSINNINQETNRVFTYTLPSDLVDNYYITSLKNNFGGEITDIELKAKHRVSYSNVKPEGVNQWWFHIKENQWKYVESSGLTTNRWWLDYGVIYMEQGVIKSFTTNNTFQAVDYNDYQTKITELEAKIETLQAAVKALQG